MRIASATFPFIQEDLYASFPDFLAKQGLLFWGDAEELDSNYSKYVASMSQRYKTSLSERLKVYISGDAEPNDHHLGTNDLNRISDTSAFISESEHRLTICGSFVPCDSHNSVSAQNFLMLFNLIHQESYLCSHWYHS